MAVVVLVLIAGLYMMWRTHRRNIGPGFAHSRGNGLAWKFAHRRRFRLGPPSWRLGSSDLDGTL